MTLELNKAIAFRDIYAVLKNEKMSFKTSYNLRKLADSAEEHFKFYTEELNKLINEYGAKDENGSFKFTEDGNSIQIKENCLAECMEKIGELETLPVEVPNVKFSIEDFNNCELSPDEVGTLMNFIE